jgi:phage gp36-like protein
MANYCTTTQLRQRLDLANISEQIEQLTKTNNATEQNTILEQFMEEACALIDSYLNDDYTVPVTTAADNAFLRGVSLDITVYELFKRGSGDKPPSKYRTNYEDGIRTLEDIAEGAMSVPGVAAKIKNTSLDITTDTTVFTEEKLQKYF